MPVRTTGELIAGRYRIEKRLGAGGMAAVFLAKDTRLEREVAVKRLHADSPDDVGRRFQREAKVGASLNHPNIVAVYDTVTDDEGVLIIMEYVAGHTLRDEIARGPMDPARAIEVLCSVAAALDHAHKHGVVHRDVKPANVLIDDAGGAVKLADLGIATAAERTRITQSGAVLGTASYMAPERLDGGAGGPGVDVYALGAVAFEMLSGRKAVEGATPLAIARRVATGPPADLREAVGDAPQAAADALKRALSRSPEDRQGSAGELVRELSAAYASQAEEQRAGTRSTAVVAGEERTNGNGNGRTAAAAAAPVPAPSPQTTRPRTEPPAEPRVHRGRGRPRWLVPAALAAAAVLLLAILAVSLGSGGGSDEQSASSGDRQEQQGSSDSSNGDSAKGGDSTATPGSDSSADSGGATGGSATPTPATPDGAVASFYQAAADDDYQRSWELSTDRLHTQVQGYDSFAASQSSMESIEFPRLEVTKENGDSAIVSFRSIAHHTDRTDRCTGSAQLVKGGEGWLLDHLDGITCTHGPA
jgi:eukaryotic-like serine/threonine-protein kinase